MMSLPPPVLHVKRKRVNEPVDSLYIESTNKRRRDIDHEFVFRRVHDDAEATDPDMGALIPLIIPTLPGHEDDVFHDTLPVHVSNDVAGRPNLPEGEEAQKRSLPPVQPRRFFFSKQNILSGSHTGSGKRKRDDLAVFVEKVQPRPKDASSSGFQPYYASQNSTVSRIGQEEDANMSDSPPPHKKPSTSARIRTPRSQIKEPDLGLEQALQQYAAEEHEKHTRGALGLAHLQPELARRKDGLISTKSSEGEIEDQMDDSEDGEYVYDTYMRHEAAKLSSTMDTYRAAGKGIGYLVINKEDEPFWEAYADDEASSDNEWDSEQDDENAENYYGADYPEDEVDSDDEFGHSAYKYRHKGASDDEEFGSDSDLWSDEGDEDRYPWKKPIVQEPTESDEDAEEH